MKTARIAQELQQPGAQELLRSGSLTRLAYLGSDGFPSVIPIGFFWNERQVVVCTVPASPKVRAITANPRVGLSIDVGSTPADSRALLLRGTAEVETVDGVPDEYLAAAGKSMNPVELAEFEQGVRALYQQMTRISVEPSWAKYYDFGAGRMPQFLVELTAQAGS